ncbi:hypothetical protein CO110_02815 [Candidatus Desantisbacteria bacterium CG_4_9_14_3_um_filter_40_11]|uniref:DUF11 domain-containing protein n=3 Tax=unclassified Candidatus Desantisiibacteriota TaxID=3106372 RepID=A0A2M7J9V7_9BACT|nr:DUF11 domain-containing protein [Bacteroidota bacterium]PIP39380.1 MAG: hypothetical protein COX18_10325 [Candidatus Desantisbacteria bacterium CG23_combo_of_CG06-09_8_20_14_all_40_23]PIX16187.1 MAG: hypothetical protein COZ71_08395 [Candidatus Desantisbacteria bacterium CG_4_8_14_3_um_filter_40_12]PJB30005.1 MAG: hypothetical protein CO110_02815 [Candidatus Desantisbacteria bacterium CG_4_9_14_3_um_filter_40_11]
MMRLGLISFFMAVFIIPGSVLAGQVILTKSGTSSAKPDEIVTYNITYQNTGTQTLNDVIIIDVIPINTVFQEASGTDTIIYYCDNSGNFGTSATLPVNKVKWVKDLVEVGGVGTVTLRVRIK